jgi:hypothetical protein
LRYSDAGEYLGVVVEDPENLSEPNGMTFSPDGSQLLVASRQNSQIIQYDFDGQTATNPTVLIDAGITVPASLEFSPNFEKIYVSNLGGPAFDGATVSQFAPDGSPAGEPLEGGLPAGRSGMAIGPAGQLYVGSFQDGAILRLDTRTQTLVPFVAPNPALFGVGNLLVHGNDLYAVGGFTGFLMKFNATTGEPDPAFVPVSMLEFPASLALAPDGNGLLVGELTLNPAGGGGRIRQFGFDGSAIGTFADSAAGGDPELGFLEATGLLVSPSLRVPLICGDADADQDVDSADMLSFLENWTGANPNGQTSATYTGGDCDLDGDVDSADMLGFLAAWTGAGENDLPASARSELAAVPEPAGLVGFACIGALTLVRRAGRTARRDEPPRKSAN